MESCHEKCFVASENGVSFYFDDNDFYCRCCLASGPSIANEPIFGENNFVHYSFCTQLPISIGDGFPKYLCQECHRKLQDFYKFSNVCRQSFLMMSKAMQAKKIHTDIEATWIKDEGNSSYYDTNTDPEKDANVEQSVIENELDDKEATNTVESSFADENSQKYKQISRTKSSKKNDKIKLATCLICKIEVRKTLLKRHMQKHDSNKQLYHCSICKKSFRSVNHFERHNKNNFIVCQICGKSIFNKTYEIHIKRHNKQKDFTCQTCGQKFYQRSLLKHHELDRHMGRKYKCDYCKKEFITKFAIRTHLYRHSEIRRFKCDMCEKAYRSHWILTLHKRTHTGVQPYKCELCQRAFTNLSQMKRHKTSHTEERSFVCEYCNFAYKYKTSYRRHTDKCKKRKEIMIITM